jgi:hypothetical protein
MDDQQVLMPLKYGTDPGFFVVLLTSQVKC